MFVRHCPLIRSQNQLLLFRAMSQDSALRQLFKSRKFWVSTVVATSFSLVFYEWYCDRYASPKTRYERIKGDYQISMKNLRKIRKQFVREMEIGLTESDNMPQNEKKSSLKMLSSHVKSIPNGDEKGIFYTLDWGGSNYRVLRIEFLGKKGSKPKTNEFKNAIAPKYQKCDSAEELFNHLAEQLKTVLSEHSKMNANISKTVPIGFTFSFPMSQPALNEGILVEWTKGFEIPGVVGHDVVKLMHSAFQRNGINAKIHAVCNDTVGTLLACAYDCDNVGLILGTGTNACYIDPKLNEIINIEWGNYANLLPRMPTDYMMDEYTPNRHFQFAEKMISGYYLGELVRLCSIEVFREKITNYAESTPLNFRWQFKSETVSAVLQCYYDGDLDGICDILRGEKGGLKDFSRSDGEIFGKICVLIINRSADLAATLLLGTLEKSGLYKCYREDERNPFEQDRFELSEEYKMNNNKIVTVGIDGSVFQYVPRYQLRMEQTIKDVVGDDIAKRIKLVHSSDGSGKGAALAVAASMKQ